MATYIMLFACCGVAAAHFKRGDSVDLIFGLGLVSLPFTSPPPIHKNKFTFVNSPTGMSVKRNRVYSFGSARHGILLLLVTVYAVHLIIRSSIQLWRKECG